MSTNFTGNVAFMKCATKLVEKGFRVSLPLDNSSPYDLIMDDGSRLFRVQVKSGSFREGVIRAKTTKLNKITKVSTKYTKDEVDYFCIFCADTDGVYLIPFSDDLPQILYLRVLPVKNNQSYAIRWAKDFQL